MRAYVLVDPVQDYEESLEILGVYGTYFEAEAAHKEARKVGGHFSPGDWNNWRDAEITLWEGGKVVKRWETYQINRDEMTIRQEDEPYVFEFEWKVVAT